MNQQKIIDVLLILGNKLLKEPYKSRWNKDNPTYGYCYLISEAIYYYSSKEFTPHCISLGKGMTHWYLVEKGTQKIYDFTADQFDAPINYSKGKGKGFMKGKIKTDKGYISLRGYQMARYLGLV